MTKNLYESLDVNTVRYAKLWESVGYAITESELSPEQINALFKNLQSQVTTSGANRTVLGKGVDIAQKVNAAFAKIKAEIADTVEVKDFDRKYSELAKKLKDATGGDQGVARYVNAYRTFAQKHPMVQKVIYSAMIAALGIAAGTGGLSATGTGATVLGLLKMTDRLLQGDKATSAIWKGFKTGAAGYAAGQIGKGFRNLATQNARESSTRSSKGVLLTDSQVNKILAITEAKLTDKLKALGGVAASAGKKAASFIGKKAAEFGSELTTKFTEKKLQTVWKQAGSPTNSDDIYKILINVGVPKELIDTVYKDAKIPIPTFSKISTINTGNTALDNTINRIIRAKGKDAAIAYLRRLKQEKESITETASGGSTASGSIASVASPVGGIIKRMPTEPNLFGYVQHNKPKKKRKKTK